MIVTSWLYKPPFGTPINRSHPWVEAGMRCFYPLNDGAGGTAINMISSQNNGVFTNSPSWVSDANGLALNFVGSSNQYVSCGFIQALQGVPQVSLFASGYISSNMNTWCIGQMASGFAYYIQILFLGGTAYFEIDHGGVGAAYGTCAAPSGYFTAGMTFDGTQSTPANRIKGYINGILQSLSITGTPPAVTPANSYSFFIGADIANSRYQTGRTGCVWICTSALPPSVHAAIGAGGNPNNIWQIFQQSQPYWLYKKSTTFIYGFDFSQIFESNLETILLSPFDIQSGTESNFGTVIPSLFDLSSGTESLLIRLHSGDYLFSSENNYLLLSNYNFDTSSSLEYQYKTQEIYSYDYSSSLDNYYLLSYIYNIEYISSIESQYLTSQIFSYDKISGSELHDFLIRFRTSDFAYGSDAGFILDTYNPYPYLIPLLLSGPSPPDTINGAITCTIGQLIGPFTVTPIKPFIGTVNFSDASEGLPNATKLYLLPSGTFIPTYLEFVNSISPQQFYYIPSAMGLRPISIMSPQGTVSAPVWIFANPI
jgi:hypothetical protein